MDEGMPAECRRNALIMTGVAAASALVGGLALVLRPDGWGLMPLGMLEHSPFRSYLVPGLLLASLVGGTSVLACAALWKRSAFALDAELLAGGTLLLFIVVDLAFLRRFHWVELAYGTLGLMIVAQATRNALRSREWRHHWIVGVSWGETLGYLAPATAGILLGTRGIEGIPLVAALTLAGLAEGSVLGFAQARSFPFTVHRARYALLTAVGAGLVWLCVMTIVELAPRLASTKMLPFAAPLGLIALGAIGGAQWTELRRHPQLGLRARAWIGWTALAWALALPLSFLASPLVDETTPFAANLALWASAGAIMAYVMALVTWQGVRHMEARSRPLRRSSHASS